MHGLDRFFSSIGNKSIPGTSFFTLVLMSVKDGVWYPMLTEQVVKQSETETAQTSKRRASEQKATTQNAPSCVHDSAQMPQPRSSDIM